MAELSQQKASEEVVSFIGSARYYHCAAYDTTLRISDDDRDDPFHHFELFDRRILWINQVTNNTDSIANELAARAVIPCQSAEDFDGVLIMNRLATLLCYVTHGQLVNPISWAGSGFPAAIMGQPRQLMHGLLYTHEQIDNAINRLSPENLSDAKWMALAHFRQGIAAQTPYYEFLSFWKIIELRFNNDSEAIKQCVDGYFEQNPALKDSLHKPDANPTATLFATRAKSAHFAVTVRNEPDLQDPDDPDIYLPTKKEASALRDLVEEILADPNW